MIINMDITAHSINALGSYLLIYYLWFHSLAPSFYWFFIILFGYLPDFDGIYWLFKGNAYDTSFQHHLYFPSHWPISYLPLWLIFIIAWGFQYYPGFFLIIPLGIYVHLICDSIAGGDGIMWGKTWKKDQYARYINLGSQKTDGYHGNYWGTRFVHTWAYRISRIEVLIFIILLILDEIIGGFDVNILIILIFFAGLLSLDLKPVPNKFMQEPQEGRYADYRKHPGYLAWMQRNNYSFDDNMHLIKQ